MVTTPSPQSTATLPVQKFRAHGGPGSAPPTVPEAVVDSLVVEEPLEIRINQRRYSATMRTPGHDRLLALGLLLSEGVITGLEDVERVEEGARCRDLNQDLMNLVNVVLHDEPRLAPHQWERSLISNSSCGLCGKASVQALSANITPLQVSVGPTPQVLLGLPAAMRPAQPLFAETGGLHAAGIFTREGQLLACFEDIGRHNATDKAIGFGLEAGWLPARDQLVLLVSGRSSFEIIQKALLAGIQTVASVSAASSLAVELAAANNLNLVGFLRPGGFNLYCGQVQ